ncbi:hypothetical protein DACRYDRAFT_103099 [Dacryopinax primogenitus]|uniref:SH3 domain-containing protein n=1 Tax=Dacryopinax primogenitus (strain DJM 731) TaxID=1858805 RepID=M5GFC7_DACPD|nr:uncharacterized protein DACRYDRAFT_103099 [Dacryopinax primogenitus]EJU06152.1 hypothetical protein DACRYDRAFT_103099 [Dacryopinax primogenitus]
MVFTDLRPEEKEAFFSVLDEYFLQRPHLLPSPSPSSDQPAAAGRKAASFVGRTLASNPQATAALVSSALRQGPKTGATTTANAGIDSAAVQLASNPRFTSALTSALTSPTPTSPPPPAPNPPSHAPTPSGLQTHKSLGSLSTDSTSSFLTSTAQGVWNYKKPKPAPPPAAKPASVPGERAEHALAAKYGPPPKRTVPHQAEAPPPQEEAEHPPPPPVPVPAAGEQEFVEALYAYQGDPATDLSLLAGERLVLLERTSTDWWTGEKEGRRGLFPASYVKVL